MHNTIKENRDFRRIYARGKSYVADCAVIYCAVNRKESTRMGVACSKKIGCAVKRNRAKRVLRSAFDKVSPKIKDGYDILLVARTVTPLKKSTEIEKALLSLLDAAGVLK